MEAEDRRCGHCGRANAGAWAAGMRLCHPSGLTLPDCYRRVTVYAEPAGALLGLEPAPAGIAGIMRRDGGTVSPQESVMASLAALTEELASTATATRRAAGA